MYQTIMLMRRCVWSKLRVNILYNGALLVRTEQGTSSRCLSIFWCWIGTSPSAIITMTWLWIIYIYIYYIYCATVPKHTLSVGCWDSFIQTGFLIAITSYVVHVCYAIHVAKMVHYSHVIMSTMASQVTGVSSVLNRLFRRRWKKTSKLCVTGLWEGNPPMTRGFPSQRASNAENVPILVTSSCGAHRRWVLASVAAILPHMHLLWSQSIVTVKSPI